jgi:hypothetical protein
MHSLDFRYIYYNFAGLISEKHWLNTCVQCHVHVRCICMLGKRFTYTQTHTICFKLYMLERAYAVTVHACTCVHNVYTLQHFNYLYNVCRTLLATEQVCFITRYMYMYILQYMYMYMCMYVCNVSLCTCCRYACT